MAFWSDTENIIALANPAARDEILVIITERRVYNHSKNLCLSLYSSSSPLIT